MERWREPLALGGSERPPRQVGSADHVRLFGPEEEGITPILAPITSTDSDTTIDALGFIINSHTMKISFPRAKVDTSKGLLHELWSITRRQVKVREVLTMVGTLRNLTYVVPEGRYFVWRLLRLTLLNDSRGSNNQNIAAEVGREF